MPHYSSRKMASISSERKALQSAISSRDGGSALGSWLIQEFVETPTRWLYADCMRSASTFAPPLAAHVIRHVRSSPTSLYDQTTFSARGVEGAWYKARSTFYFGRNAGNYLNRVFRT